MPNWYQQWCMNKCQSPHIVSDNATPLIMAISSQLASKWETPMWKHSRFLKNNNSHFCDKTWLPIWWLYTILHNIASWVHLSFCGCICGAYIVAAVEAIVGTAAVVVNAGYGAWCSCSGTYGGTCSCNYCGSWYNCNTLPLYIMYLKL